MDVYRTWMWITILCLIQDYGSCSIITEGPNNVTVLSGSNASFLCTVASGWQSISWYLRDIYIVSIDPSVTKVGNDYTIIVQNSTNSLTGAFTSEITIVNVNKTNSGTVRCSSLSASFKDAYLSVQVMGSVQITNGNVTVTPNSTVSMICQAAQWYPAPTITWQINNTLADTLYYSTAYTTDANDYVTARSTFKINPETDLNLTCLASIQTLSQPQSATVDITVKEFIPGSSSSLSQTAIILIAVFVSLGGLLLLIVIILLIIFCCRKEKKKKTESGYQSDAWKTPDKNDNKLRTIEIGGLGENNYAYSPGPGPYSSDLSPYSTDPEPVKQSSGSIDDNSVYFEITSTSTASSLQIPEHLKKTRHVTHV